MPNSKLRKLEAQKRPTKKVFIPEPNSDDSDTYGTISSNEDSDDVDVELAAMEQNFERLRDEFKEAGRHPKRPQHPYLPNKVPKSPTGQAAFKNFQSRQAFEIYLKKDDDGGWAVQPKFSGRSLYQVDKCVVCGHKQCSFEVKKVKMRLINCNCVVCEDCTHKLFFRMGEHDFDADKRTDWEAKGRGSYRNQCPGCQATLGSTLMMVNLSGEIMEVRAPIPYAYFGNHPVLFKSTADALSPFYNQFVDYPVRKYFEIKEELAFLEDAPRRSDSVRPTLETRMDAAEKLFDYLESKKKAFDFAITGNLPLPDAFMEQNSAYYEFYVNLDRVERLVHAYQHAKEADEKSFGVKRFVFKMLKRPRLNMSYDD